MIIQQHSDAKKKPKMVGDGQTVRVPLHLMDAMSRDIATVMPSQVGGQPSPYAMTDAEREARIARQLAYDASVSDAWKTVAPQPAAPVPTATPAPAPAAGDETPRAIYELALMERWRGVRS